METRTIKQVKLHTLLLNPMMDRIESIRIVAAAYDVDKLRNWYDGLKVAQYKDGRWNKSFQQGSELEWFNPMEIGTGFGSGFKEEWIEADIVESVLARHKIKLIV